LATLCVVDQMPNCFPRPSHPMPWSAIPVFKVAAEGGGMRAGYMTFKTLCAFEVAPLPLAEHLLLPRSLRRFGRNNQVDFLGTFDQVFGADGRGVKRLAIAAILQRPLAQHTSPVGVLAVGVALASDGSYFSTQIDDWILKSVLRTWPFIIQAQPALRVRPPAGDACDIMDRVKRNAELVAIVNARMRSRSAEVGAKLTAPQTR
jgi:hypothetical protein